MSEPFVGQIEIFGFGFAPRYWAVCAGQTLPIQQNMALFSLLGTAYGGNGVSTFQLPDLRGRVPMGQGQAEGQQWTIGTATGTETVAPQRGEFPAHTHSLMAASSSTTTTNTDVPSPSVVLGTTTGVDENGGPFSVPIYVNDANPAIVMHQSAVAVTGGQPHENRMPYLVLNFCISLSGIFPSRN